MSEFRVSGNIVDLEERGIFPGTIRVSGGKILSIDKAKSADSAHYILPGFIDAHVHIESSMLVPSEFARLAVVHGTVATVSDPHEIGNVLGTEGVRYMVQNGKRVPFHFFFGAPSCVPATPFETAGASITPEEIEALFANEKLKYLSEMMNYPGVLENDPLVMEKIAIAKKWGLPIDGHAPGLKGEKAARYVSAGISTDHECYTHEEALDKLNCGMKIIIREGSAAKNYEALHPLIKTHPEMVMFCSDDKHPNDLVKGHINELVKRSILQHGYELMDVLRCACTAPIKHYGLDVGTLKKGDNADFIVVDNLKDFNVLKTYIKGELVAERGKTLIESVKTSALNNFNIGLKKEEDFSVSGSEETLQVIHALNGELVTNSLSAKPKIVNSFIVSDTDRDILKLVVVNRYHNAPIAKAFIHGFGLKKGALASCIAHDSHNIIAVGVSDSDICKAVNAIIENKGGISAADGNSVEVLPLPVAGIMSAEDGYKVAEEYFRIDKKAKSLGSALDAPFMTLSFMALLVIPSLKLSDKGLFDGNAFRFIDKVYSEQ